VAKTDKAADKVAVKGGDKPASTKAADGATGMYMCTSPRILRNHHSYALLLLLHSDV